MEKKHGWSMLLGCGLMLAALFFFWGQGVGVETGSVGEGAAAATATSSGGLGNWIWLIFLACPLMHLFMMRGHKGCQSPKDTSGVQDYNASSEENSGPDRGPQT